MMYLSLRRVILSCLLYRDKCLAIFLSTKPSQRLHQRSPNHASSLSPALCFLVVLELAILRTHPLAGLYFPDEIPDLPSRAMDIPTKFFGLLPLEHLLPDLRNHN